MNKKQKIFLAIFVPIVIFFVALSIAYYITSDYGHFRSGIQGRVTGRWERGDYSIVFHKPFDWGQTWYIWVFTLVCIIIFEYKIY